MTHLGIAMWFWLFHAERYLQSLLPWMAGIVASLAILAWRSGWAARVGVVALGGLQVVWGLDMIFWPLHRMTGKSQIALANDFFAKGYGSAGAGRLKPFEDFAQLGRALPRGAKVLIHHEHTRLGLNAASVSDAPRIQYGINYAELGSPAGVARWFRDNGITHVVWQPGTIYGEEPVGAELVFHAYASSFVVVERAAGRTLGKLPDRPPQPRSDEALVHLCDGTYAPGIYAVSALNVSPYPLAGFKKVYPSPSRPISADDDSALASLGYAVVDSSCRGAPRSLRNFTQTAAAGKIRYYVQNQNAEP
jgi:hypothetical protein